MVILELIFDDILEDELLIVRAGQRGKYWKKGMVEMIIQKYLRRKIHSTWIAFFFLLGFLDEILTSGISHYSLHGLKSLLWCFTLDGIRWRW
jgi:hypothetical protein